MNKKLPWREIKRNFSGQWVELVDYKWDWSESHPRSAKVINSSSNRAKLLQSGSKDSVILYVSNSQSFVGSYHEPGASVANF